MRLLITSLLVVGSVSATAGASQAPGGAATAGKACALLTRDLAMKVSSAAGRKAVERDTPVQNPEGIKVPKGASACWYGPIILVLDGMAEPERIRKEMRARGGPRDRAGVPVYKDYEPVPGVGDEAFFYANRTYSAYLNVWTGSRSFAIEMMTEDDEDGKALRPNVIALAKAIVPLLK
jgi:hypothetical protein